MLFSSLITTSESRNRARPGFTANERTDNRSMKGKGEEGIIVPFHKCGMRTNGKFLLSVILDQVGSCRCFLGFLGKNM